MLKNVVIVNDFAHADGGAGKVAIDVAFALSDTFNVYFFTSVKPIDNRFENSNIKLICVGKPDILTDSNRWRAITKGLFDSNIKKQFQAVLANLNPNETIVHVHTWTKALTSAVFCVTAKMDFHLVLTLHDFFVSCPNGGFFNYYEKKICELRSLSCRCIFTDCDARSYPQKIWRILRLLTQNHFLWKNKKLTLLYISDICKNMLISYIPSNVNMVYLPDPVDLASQGSVTIVDNEYYLYLGRLSPEKGIVLFCDAISELGLKGLVVGDGYLRKELEKKYPQIQFVGWASGEKKERCMKSAKALVFPSFWAETYGLVIAEAKSYGIPCIVPNKCAASEQIEDGQNGYIFETGNLNSLKSAIKKYETTDIKMMQQKLISSFDREALSMNTHIVKLIDIYNKILKS